MGVGEEEAAPRAGSRERGWLGLPAYTVVAGKHNAGKQDLLRRTKKLLIVYLKFQSSWCQRLSEEPER